MDDPIEPTSEDVAPHELEVAEQVEAELVPLEEDELLEEAPPPVGRAPVYRGTGVRWSYVFGALLTVSVIILAAQNTESVEFEFLTWDITAPLAAVILATAFVAVVIDELVGVVWRFRRRRHLRDKAELRELRAQSAQSGRRWLRRR